MLLFSRAMPWANVVSPFGAMAFDSIRNYDSQSSLSDPPKFRQRVKMRVKMNRL